MRRNKLHLAGFHISHPLLEICGGDSIGFAFGDRGIGNRQGIFLFAYRLKIVRLRREVSESLFDLD